MTKRFLNRDGSFNIDPGSYPPRQRSDLYHNLISVSWTKLFALLGVGYLAVNAAFGFLYYAAGPSALSGLDASSPFGRFMECFFFSVQTLATIGYGKISPSGYIAHGLVVLEALVGLLTLTVATGIVFARFSKPSAKVIFSEKAIIAPQDGVSSLIFRIANKRLNQIAEAQVAVVLAKNERTLEGEHYRNFHDLALERSKSPMFTMSWTVTHPITESSPLFGATREDLEEWDAEIIVTVNGLDVAVSQMVASRYSYIAEEILWNAQFEDMITRSSDGSLRMALGKISDIKASREPPRLNS